jgi:hypothetical protein
VADRVDGAEPGPDGSAAPAAAAAAPARRALYPLFLGTAGLLACWNPLSAPFAFVVGVAAVILGWRALRRGSGRSAAAAVATGALAALASVVIVGLTAGAVGIELPGEPVVQGRSPTELDRVLDGAAERTRAARERARQELEKLGAAPDAGAAPRPRDGGR